jgi:hypothetical protein
VKFVSLSVMMLCDTLKQNTIDLIKLIAAMESWVVTRAASTYLVNLSTAKTCVISLPYRDPIARKAMLMVSVVALLLARVVGMRTVDKLRTF